MENIVVIEFGTYIATPLVTWHLQSAGAKVTSIKRPKHARGYQQEAVWLPYMTEFLQSGKNSYRAWRKVKHSDQKMN